MTIFLPFLIITLPKSSTLGGPRGESDGGGEGWYSAGNVANTSISVSVSVSDDEGGEREWIAGALMNMVLNGFLGFESTGISIGYSNDSN